jgi:hypothetical protein
MAGEGAFDAKQYDQKMGELCVPGSRARRSRGRRRGATFAEPLFAAAATASTADRLHAPRRAPPRHRAPA